MEKWNYFVGHYPPFSEATGKDAAIDRITETYGY
jgi:hypothetical protein